QEGELARRVQTGNCKGWSFGRPYHIYKAKSGRQNMKQRTKRTVGVSRLLGRLSRGQATLSDRAWTLSPLAWPLSKFLSSLRGRFVTMRQASIDISLNTARLHAQTQACRDMASEQASESEGIAARGSQIAAMSEETSASVNEIAATFHVQM